MLVTAPTPVQMPSSSAAPAATRDRASVQRQFNDLAMDMTRSDVELTDAVNRNLGVGAGWDTWFGNVAGRMLDARDAYVQLMPNDSEMIARLGSDSLDLASSGGTLSAAHSNSHKFGSGWDTTLDRKIDNAREAANRLFDAPTNPSKPGSGVAQAAGAAAALARQSLATIMTVPVSDRGSEQTKQARVAAYQQNLQAQRTIEPLFDTAEPTVASQLRAADANLQDANWQLAKKPSTDGRFNGVDIPGARRSTEDAIAALDLLSR